MNKNYVTLVFALLLAVLMALPACAERRWLYKVINGAICQDDDPFVFNAVEVNGLAKPGVSYDQFITKMFQLADAGANALSFDLEGYNKDGSWLSDDVIAAYRERVQNCNWRNIAVICRIFGPDAPQDQAWRLNAVRTAASLLKEDCKAIYWIDGPNSAELAAEFLKKAPQLVVVAPEGGMVDVVSAIPTTPSTKPVFLKGAIPPADQLEKINFVLPDTDQTIAELEKGLADPAESKPWTPDNSVLTEEQRKDGWINLFDGKTLDGWWIRGPKDTFWVENGLITCKGSGGSSVCTKDRYDNFALHMEWKIPSGGNSGLYLRAPRSGRVSAIGMEFQLQDDYGKPIESHIAGAVYSQVPPLVNAVKPAGEWNTVDLTLEGGILTAKLNGQLVHDKLNLDDNPELKFRLRKGYIGLQDHTKPAYFRNIWIKKL